MKFQKSLLASATTAALAAAGSAQASNLGEFWAVDQINGTAHIFSQAELNDPTVDAAEDTVQINIQGHADGVPSVRMHILGFSNHAGIDPASRTILSYLDGWMEIWNTNGGTGAPTPAAAAIEVSTANTYAEEKLGSPDKGSTIHACGGNPQNDQIQCASIFNGDFTLFEADMTTDTYTRIGIFRTGDLPLSKSLNKNKDLKNAVQAAYDDMVATDVDNNPHNICSQYSTDGNLLYIAAQTGTNTGGVIVVDVSKPSSPAILDAFSTVMAAGCGLVNNPDGEHLWITHGFNKQGDPEEVSIWSYANAGVTNGPVDRVALPTEDEGGEDAIYGGDAHGAQYAGLLSTTMWQVMRIDDVVHVISNNGGAGELVNTIDLETEDRKNIQPDVIDRSAFGTRMYWTTRGPRPTSAIGNPGGASTKYNASDRLAGVDVWNTNFLATDGYFVKQEGMDEGKPTIHLCPGTPYEQVCAAGDEGAVEVTSADPHGGKSLNYLSGF